MATDILKAGLEGYHGQPASLALALLHGSVTSLDASELPLFDAHTIPPKDAIATLRKAGVVRAPVSSSSDEGTQK